MNPTYHLKKLFQRFRLQRALEYGAWSLALGGLCFGLMGISGVSDKNSLLSSMALTVIVFTFLSIRNNLWDKDYRDLVRFLDFNFPELENSTGLLMEDHGRLGFFQTLQQKKIAQKLEDVSSHVRFPNRLRSAIIVCMIVLGTVAILALTPGSDGLNFHKSASLKTPSSKPEILPSGIKEMTLYISPPSYTAVGAITTSSPSSTVPEGSIISWRIVFDRKVKIGKVIIGNRDTLEMHASNRNTDQSKPILTSTFYQVVWHVEGDSMPRFSDFYPLQIKEDRPPEINTSDFPQFTEVLTPASSKLTFTALLNDDYGLTDAYVVATVSKGSGEAVKFREERIAFSSPASIRGKAVKANLTIDLGQLGMEVGDELYFYVASFDNKVPVRQFSRSQTFFVSVPDTTEVETVFDDGLGIDLMPEYFRSQRQIIIDSEKLLANRSRIPKSDFESRSNDLAHDQKVLRLRYGQFLGEEFESELVPTESDGEHQHEHHHDHDTDDVAKEYGHTHDHGNEHNLVPDHKHEHQHEDAGNDGGKSSILEQFAHMHDDPEEATFFTNTIRAKLKATLSLMWDAELHLRLSDPAKSLPYQRKALQLLKEISNDSRIYVHKTGFDSPPVKEENRLSGDLSEVGYSHDTHNQLKQDRFAHTKAAYRITEQLINSPRQPSDRELDILMDAGRELGSLAVEEPGKYLEALAVLQKAARNPRDQEQWKHLNRVLYRVIPSAPSAPARRWTTVHLLDSLLIQHLPDQ